MRRHEKIAVYLTYTEVVESKKYAPAMPISGETVQTSGKGETGHGVWLDAAIDFFSCAGDDRQELDRLHLSEADATGRYTQEEKRICRKFWKAVKERRLDLTGMRILERMAA